MLWIIGIGGLFSFGVLGVTKWYYNTNHDRKLQASAAQQRHYMDYFLLFTCLFNNPEHL